MNYEVTNDAYVDQYIVPVNVRVSGYIKEVRFTEHQFVHEGDTLLLPSAAFHLARLSLERVPVAACPLCTPYFF